MTSAAPGALEEPLNIAILLNSYRSKILPAIQASYIRTIRSVAPDAKLTFFEPANTGQFPDPKLFDLIVFGGGNVDARKSHPWILNVHGFLRDLVYRYPEKKVLGICWGHQTIARVFDGELEDMDEPEMGVTSINLTESGLRFFPHAAAAGSMRIQQHHRREVKGSMAGKGFVSLAHGNQILLRNNTILTFQGHPEKDAEAAAFRMSDSSRWFGFSSSDEKAWTKLKSQIEMEHEGPVIWKRIFNWVREPARGHPIEVHRQAALDVINGDN